MHNNVVETVTGAFAGAGWGTLRFNFRGVGQSTGAYDQGEGEQDDLAAAVSFVISQGARGPAVVGYSFGAWVAVSAWHTLKDLETAPLVLIAPPVAAMKFDKLSHDTEVALMICGEHDEIAPPDLARELGQSLDSPVEPVVIAGADHFFFGEEEAVSEVLSRLIVQL
jgi:alpha/beta superfamily hydrolase